MPLNYSSPDAGNATIALARIPSSLPTNSSEYRGPILVNPGGPGGSGVNFISSFGKNISAIVGPQFDIVGFDPRGTEFTMLHAAVFAYLLIGLGRSTPSVNFFKTDADRAIWEASGIKILDPSPEGLGRLWAQVNVLGQMAEDSQGDVLRHFNTDQTARDMLRITEAYGRKKLQYWGISYVSSLVRLFSILIWIIRYGTALGATFAAMFPVRFHWCLLVFPCSCFFPGIRTGLSALSSME